MKKRIMISAIVATAFLGASAQINSPLSNGYQERAIFLYQDKNYQGCIDQMSQLLDMNPTMQQKETAKYYIAMSALMTNNANAETLLRAFISEFPTSIYRMDVKMAIGDYYFIKEDYATSLAQYKLVDVQALEYPRAQDYTYRKAYSHLRLADYSDAEAGFKSLLGSPKYDNSAKFYSGYVAYINKDYNEALNLFDQVDDASELGGMTNYYKCQIYFLNKDYKKAYDLSRKMLNKDVEPLYIAEANRIAGESLYNMGDVVSAIPYLQNYVKGVELPLPSTQYILGVSHYKNHEYEKAIKSLEAVTQEKNALGQGAYLMIGQSFLKSKDYNAAMLALDKATKMDYDLEAQELAFYNYAVASSHGGAIPFGNSVANFEEFLRRYPNSRFVPQVQEYVVTGYMTDNNYERALASIEKIENPNDEILKVKQRVLYTLGTRDFSQGKINQAISRLSQSKSYSIYDEALAREADLWLGDCYYAQGDYDAATDSYSTYVEASTKDVVNLPLAYYNIGYSCLKNDQYDEAIANFEKALNNYGNLDSEVIADAYTRIGDCFYFKSDFTTALTSYDKAYNANKATGDYALYQKAMMNGYRKDLTMKVKNLDELLEQYPTSGIVPSALLEKAQCYVEKNKYPQAIETYKQLVREYPATTQGRNGCLQLAIAYLNNNRETEAINAYKNVIATYPTSDEARVACQDLMRIYAKNNNLEAYTAFVSTVPDALPVEQSYLEDVAYEAAHNAYLEGLGFEQIRSYLKKYPGSVHEPSALAILAKCEYENNNNEAKALKYADDVITRYPDNAAVETALSVKAEIEYNQGKSEMALADYEKLEERASTKNMIAQARMGQLRAAYDLDKYSIVIKKAEELMTSKINGELLSEVKYAKAVALNNTGKPTEAIELWASLDDNVEDLYGAMSAIELAQYYYEFDNLKEARVVVEDFINSSSPHQYWLARGYILLSDINRKEGKLFEANEYLRTLRENYPGGDADIFKMIDERLK